jgi:hypothetical protein
MIYQDYQIKGLEKLANSFAIKTIYPMVEEVKITRPDDQPYLEQDREIWNIDIFVNDPKIIDSKSMYDAELDPHYLIDYHLVSLLPYLGIDQKKRPLIDFVVWDTNGNSIDSWSDWGKK